MGTAASDSVIERRDQNTSPVYGVEISQNVLFLIFGVIVGLLLINIWTLCYLNGCGRKQSRKKKHVYSKVVTIGSSDQDIQHLKEIVV